ncbi:TPA: hypothetical protein N0F65_005143 [Lagenidium giganteum]|uniref:Uncharacterized protein n=1 Tax=Lagenidium giganteum TaxID=4803 RepID=A0AAV2YSS3_9STRA|nr:TPA: hypothetical protein N0F65_005143 [Lagenidium giganteum]
MSTKRTLALDAPLREYLAACVRQRKTFYLGLLIGQASVSSPADTVVAAVQVPSELGECCAMSLPPMCSLIVWLAMLWLKQTTTNTHNPLKTCQQTGCRTTPSRRVVTERHLCDEGFRSSSSAELWLLMLCQVDRLLPGGLTVLGLFVVSVDNARTVFDQASCYLRAVAEALAVPVNFQATGDDSSVYYILHLSPTTSQQTCKAYHSINDAPKTNVVPADLKPLPASFEPIKYVANVAVNETLAFTPITAAEGDDAIAIVERRMEEVTEQLVPLAAKVLQAIGVPMAKSLSASSTDNEVMLLSPLSEQLPQDVAVDSKQTLVGSLNGTISCLAFVSAAEADPFQSAVHYLKRDFVKSLRLRMELVLEKWADDAVEVAELQQQFLFRDGGNVCLPRRAAMTWQSTVLPTSARLTTSLHVFPDDDFPVAVRNALEILGVPGAATDSASEEDDSKASQMADHASSLAFLEEDPVDHDVAAAARRGTQHAAAASPPITAVGTSHSTLLLALALLVVIVAIALQMLMK